MREIMKVSMSSSLGLQLSQNCWRSVSELYVQLHITNPVCYRGWWLKIEVSKKCLCCVQFTGNDFFFICKFGHEKNSG